MTENEISYLIRGSIMEVYRLLGPGIYESVYIAALKKELINRGLMVSTEVALPVIYKEEKQDLGFRLDMLVEDKVIVEVKSVEHLLEVHHKQLITYLKLSGMKLGILVNFNVAYIQEGIFRKVNGL